MVTLTADQPQETVRAGHHHEIALIRLRHVGQEVADLQLQHRHPRSQVAETVVGAVDMPACAGRARSFLPERVGGMEVRLALVEQGEDVGHQRRVVGQLQEQRIIRQQVEDPGTACMVHTRPREVRRAARSAACRAAAAPGVARSPAATPRATEPRGRNQGTTRPPETRRSRTSIAHPRLARHSSLCLGLADSAAPDRCRAIFRTIHRT